MGNTMSTLQRQQGAVTDKCHFLELPPELRNRIYELVVVLDYEEAARLSENPSFFEPALTRTNRQIHMEALPVYYGQTVFRLHLKCLNDTSAFKKWLRSLDSEIALVRHLELKPCRDCDVSLLIDRRPSQENMRISLKDDELDEENYCFEDEDEDCEFLEFFCRKAGEGWLQNAAEARGKGGT